MLGVLAVMFPIYMHGIPSNSYFLIGFSMENCLRALNWSVQTCAVVADLLIPCL